MDIETQMVGHVGIFILFGRFDAQHVDVMKQEFKAALQHVSDIVVDLEEVDFMDSAALATLVQGLKHCRQAGGDLRICNLQGPVLTIFELTRLDRAFTLFDSQTAAVNSFHD